MDLNRYMYNVPAVRNNRFLVRNAALRQCYSAVEHIYFYTIIYQHNIT